MQSQMAPSELAGLVEHQLRRMDSLLTASGTLFLHILGPPSIGKTAFRHALAGRLADLRPCYVPCSSFVMPRRERLARSVSECSEGAYDLTSLESVLMSLVNGGSVVVPEYDHHRGIFGEYDRTLHPSRLIYIEGPAWLHCCDHPWPQFTLLMEPIDLRHWQKAYVFRNTHFRGYAKTDAQHAFELALSGWMEALSRANPAVDMRVGVEFEGQTYAPEFRVVRATKGIQVQLP